MNSEVDLRRKIARAGELQTIVRMMKSAAASRVSQYEQSVRALAGHPLANVERRPGHQRASDPPGPDPRVSVCVDLWRLCRFVGQ